MRRARVAWLLLVCLALFSCTDPTAYTFAVVGDFQQPDGSGYLPVTHEIVREIAASDARFVVIVGDLIAGTGDERWREFDELVQPLRDAGKPLHAVIGNNDLNSAKMGEGFDERFGSRTGVAAERGVHLVFLDTETHADGYQTYELGDEQTAWLQGKPWKKELSAGPNPLLFFFLHRPVYRSEAMQRDLTGKYGRDRPDLAALLEGLGADAVFCGHEHVFDKRETERTTYVITGGGGGKLIPVYGYHHFLRITVSPKKRSWSLQVQKVAAPKS